MHRVVGIRWKVLTVLGLPVLVLALASGAASFTAVQDARDARAVGAFAAAQDGALRVQAALQAERLASLAPQVVDLAAARATTDREIAAFDRAVAATRVVESVPEALAALAAAQNAHARLPELRRLVDAGPTDGSPSGAVATGYDAVIEADVDLPGAVGEVLGERDLGRRLAVAGLLGRAGEATQRAYLVGLRMVATGAASPDEQRALGLALADRSRALDAFRAQAALSTPAEATELATAAAAVDAVAQRFSDGTTPVTRSEWAAATERLTAGVRDVTRRVTNDAALSAERLAVTAEQRAALVGGAAVAVVGLMVLLALMQSRRITDPLLGLASAATRSRERLPEVVEAVVQQQPDVELPPIEVSTRDEIGAVAAAFRDVQATVVDIAQQQAALRVILAETFVNVARRNQVLLGRQLALIDRLERTEEDPVALENLFRLDHLATRMRRNAESLLVLAGIDSGRQLRQAMPASDVVRTAVSEIEQYERVQVYAETDPAVVAPLALPLAHLLAELVENATQFSDPSTTVVVHIGGTGGHVQVTVRDNGLGMSADDLSTANERLDAYRDHAPVGAEAIGSQRLGLFVVARLAAKLGASVRLHSRSGGTEAVVDLPPTLFVAPVPDADPWAGAGTVPPPEPLVGPTPAPTLVPPPAAPTYDPVPLPRRGHAAVAPATPGSTLLPEPAPAPTLLPEPAPAPTPGPVPRGMVDVLPKQVQRSHFGLGRRGRRSRHDPEPEPFLPPTDPAAEPGLRPRGAAQRLGPVSDTERDGATDAALRSAIASQALTELSLLASYSPVAQSPSTAGLARRAPAPPPQPERVILPDAEASPEVSSVGREARTPEGVRSTFAAFAAGTARGRSAG